MTFHHVTLLEHMSHPQARLQGYGSHGQDSSGVCSHSTSQLDESVDPPLKTAKIRHMSLATARSAKAKDYPGVLEREASNRTITATLTTNSKFQAPKSKKLYKVHAQQPRST